VSYPILSYPIWRKTIALWGNWTGSYNDCKSCIHHLPLSYCAIIQIQSGTNMEALRSYIRYELWVCSYWLNCKFQSLTTWWLGELILANILASYNNRPFFPSLKLYILYGSLSVCIMLVSCTGGAWSAQVFKFCCQAPLGSWLWPQEWSAFCSSILVHSHLGFLSTGLLRVEGWNYHGCLYARNVNMVQNQHKHHKNVI
jgi:hypothetical protein